MANKVLITIKIENKKYSLNFSICFQLKRKACKYILIELTLLIFSDNNTSISLLNIFTGYSNLLNRNYISMA